MTSPEKLLIPSSILISATPPSLSILLFHEFSSTVVDSIIKLIIPCRPRFDLSLHVCKRYLIKRDFLRVNKIYGANDFTLTLSPYNSGAMIFLWWAQTFPFEVRMPWPSKEPSSFCWYEGFPNSNDVHVLISLTTSARLTYNICVLPNENTNTGPVLTDYITLIRIRRTDCTNEELIDMGGEYESINMCLSIWCWKVLFGYSTILLPPLLKKWKEGSSTVVENRWFICRSLYCCGLRLPDLAYVSKQQGWTWSPNALLP